MFMEVMFIVEYGEKFKRLCKDTRGVEEAIGQVFKDHEVARHIELTLHHIESPNRNAPLSE